MSFSATQIDNVCEYIRSHWQQSVHDDSKNPPPANVVALPVPHTVPCLHGHFPVFFYWDTYFTNSGLLSEGRLDLAKSNCEAMAWLIERYGFVPNNTFRSDLNRSQPPYFSLMVRELYEQSGDRQWLARMAAMVKKEYQFWMTARFSPLGLNRHGEHAERTFLLRFYNGLLHNRLGLPLETGDQDKIESARLYLSEAETGWDFNPRFEQRCPDFCPVDLNSNLWRYEKDLAFYALETGSGDAGYFEEMADRRQELMRRYLWDDGRNMFMDFDVVNMKPSPVASLASFHPLFLGLATEREAALTMANLPLFECDHGLAVCEKIESNVYYQWGYPNGWPPLTMTVVLALMRYGRKEDAGRIAEKYIDWAVRYFERTGQLWEKFDAVTGTLAGGEYEAQPMMGWSAGVLVKMVELWRSQQ